MKSDKYLLSTAALLLVWSMRSEAHDSQEAIRAGGTLLQLTRALLHPIVEMPYLPNLLVAGLLLGFVFGPVIMHLTRRRIDTHSSHQTVAEKRPLPQNFTNQ